MHGEIDRKVHKCAVYTPAHLHTVEDSFVDEIESATQLEHQNP